MFTAVKFISVISQFTNNLIHGGKLRALTVGLLNIKRGRECLC